MTTAQGSTGNVVAAVCSFFLPGLGQLVQGRLLAALVFFLATGVFYAFSWMILPLIPAVLLHIWCIVDCARFRPAV